MKCMIPLATVLFCIGTLSAEESPDSLIQRMLRRLQEPHSYEVVLDKRDNLTPDMRMQITKNGPQFHARIYLGNELVGEEIFDGASRYFINLSDSSIICTGKLVPGDANLYLLELNDLELAYMDMTDEAAKSRSLRKIGVYDPTENAQQPLIVYSIDPAGPVPVSLWWSAMGHRDIFRNFKFGICPGNSEFTFDRAAMKDYTFQDCR